MDIVNKKVDLRPEKCVNQLQGKLRLSGKMHSLAYEIAKSVGDKMFLEGKNPFTIAGAAVLLATKLIKDEGGDRITTEKIAEAAKLAPGTIRSAAKEMKNFQKDILPPEYSTKEKLNLIQLDS